MKRWKQQSNIAQFSMLLSPLVWVEPALFLLTLPSSPTPAPSSSSTSWISLHCNTLSSFPSLSPQYLLHMFSLVLVDLPDGVELAVTRPDLFVQTELFLLAARQTKHLWEQPFSYCSSARCIRGLQLPTCWQQQPRLGGKTQQGALLIYRKRNPQECLL